MNPAESPTPQTAAQVIPLSRLGQIVSPPPAPASETPLPARPAGPRAPELAAMLHTLECGQPFFREPEDHEWIVGLYRDDQGYAFPVLLWADPDVDLFWDLHLRCHVRPPAFYLRLAQQPQIDPISGYPVVNGAVCPY